MCLTLGRLCQDPGIHLRVRLLWNESHFLQPLDYGLLWDEPHFFQPLDDEDVMQTCQAPALLFGELGASNALVGEI